MTRLFQVFLFCVMAFFMSFPCMAEAAPKNWVEIEQEQPEKAPAPVAFSAQELKRMSVFLSNFTEVGLYNIDAKEFLSGKNPSEMLWFGIRHNYINAFKRTVKPCPVPDCRYGSLVMDVKHVKQAFQRYFGSVPTQGLPSKDDDNRIFFDGTLYHFEGADGDPTYYAGVKSAVRLASGLTEMRGTIYNAENPKEVTGTFVALARDHVWNGKPTWALVRLETSSVH
ncbi:MAG: hypothetical protein J6I40_01335 [Mailhella sp.]|nr:hypothetical protein [Mailhella sp.]